LQEIEEGKAFGFHLRGILSQWIPNFQNTFKDFQNDLPKLAEQTTGKHNLLLL
jgi:hypothetical protein